MLRSRDKSMKKKPEEISKLNETDLLLSFVCRNKTYISIIVRLLSIVSCCTYYVPDEYWQSTEVAHRNVYGYGYLTWEWNDKIRSYLHPYIFELYFRFVNIIGLDFAEVLLYGPHLLQAILSVTADNAVYRLAHNIFRNEAVAIFSLILHWISWFVFYTSARTLSNTVEMCFLVIGLSYFPFSSCGSLPSVILYGGIGCIIRSTSLIFWCPFMLGALIYEMISFQRLLYATIKMLPLLLIFSFVVDYYFYKEFVFVHYNFLKFNIFENFSAFYGTHSFHWYLTQGIPVVFSFHILLIVAGACLSKSLLMFWMAIFYVIVHSFIPHKEFRFLLPTVPIFMCYAGLAMLHINNFSIKLSRRILMFLFLVNAAFAAYFSLVHQRGTISVMSHLRNKQLEKHNRSVLFLMPCHSTPYYSHLHQNVRLKFLTCVPSNRVDYVDESTQFYNNPVLWLDANIVEGKQKPTYIVMFNVLSKQIYGKLTTMQYKKEAMFFHTHFPEGRIGSHVEIYTSMKDTTL